MLTREQQDLADMDEFLDLVCGPERLPTKEEVRAMMHEECREKALAAAGKWEDTSDKIAAYKDAICIDCLGVVNWFWDLADRKVSKETQRELQDGTYARMSAEYVGRTTNDDVKAMLEAIRQRRRRERENI